MDSIIKHWDDNVIFKNVGNELKWLFNYLDENNFEKISYIDIGANVGKFYDEISKKYKVEKCIMVEPSKGLNQYMVEKYQGVDSITLYDFAISDQNGMFKFVDTAQEWLDFFHKNGIDNTINLGISQLSHNVSGDTQCYSMDYFLRNFSTITPKEITFIKIDTENYDLPIIKSMTKFIFENDIRPFIIFENNYHNIMSTNEAIDIIDKFCKICGYEKVDLSASGDCMIIPKKNHKYDKMKEVYSILQNFKIDKKFWRYQNLTGEDYDIRRSKPAPYTKTAIEIAKVLGLKTVVEIGSSRYAVTQNCLHYFDTSNSAYLSPPCCCDGHGGFFWTREGFELYTVDIDENCRNGVLWGYSNLNIPVPENLHVEIPRDGIEFLTNFDKKIDVLFLDGWDIGTHEYAERHLDAYLASKDKLSKTHLVLIDDTDYITVGGGKDRLLSPYLIENNYIPLFNGRQTLYLKHE
jgi:FkbM family methyltransferase